jgi:hypothetical protein
MMPGGREGDRIYKALALFLLYHKTRLLSADSVVIGRTFFRPVPKRRGENPEVPVRAQEESF